MVAAAAALTGTRTEAPSGSRAGPARSSRPRRLGARRPGNEAAAPRPAPPVTAGERRQSPPPARAARCHRRGASPTSAARARRSLSPPGSVAKVRRPRAPPDVTAGERRQTPLAASTDHPGGLGRNAANERARGVWAAANA
ncbi:uncharacterized protein LOC128928309 [Callithrix jacchus]